MSVIPFRTTAGVVTTVSPPRHKPKAPPTDEQIAHSLRRAVASIGMAPPETVIVDGKYHYFMTGLEKKPNRPKGWYVVYRNPTFVAGAFGSFLTGEKYKWRYRD